VTPYRKPDREEGDEDGDEDEDEQDPDDVELERALEGLDVDIDDLAETRERRDERAQARRPEAQPRRAPSDDGIVIDFDDDD
jgi:hypothetical protein